MIERSRRSLSLLCSFTFLQQTFISEFRHDQAQAPEYTSNLIKLFDQSNRLLLGTIQVRSQTF